MLRGYMRTVSVVKRTICNLHTHSRTHRHPLRRFPDAFHAPRSPRFVQPHSVTGLATPPPDPGSSVSSVSGSRGDQSAASQSTTGAAPSAAVGAGGAVASAQSQVIDVAGASASEWQRIPTAPAGTVSANGLLHPAGSHAPLRNTVGGDLARFPSLPFPCRPAVPSRP